MAGSFAGTTLSYPRRPGDHPLVGTRAAAIPLTAGRVTELQRTSGFVLIRERGAVALPGDLLQAERADAGPAVLVRPDGYVCWAGQSDDQSGWGVALKRFGAAQVSAAAQAHWSLPSAGS